MNLAGFDVLECEPIWHDYVLSATVKARTPSDLNGLDRYRTALETSVSTYLGQFARHRVAVWGAGHQSLALISLLSLQDRIPFVIDSAPFKQNRFTPATHLPIVPPDCLREGKVDAVMIMAGSYSEEVAALIRRDYDPALHVAILQPDGLCTM